MPNLTSVTNNYFPTVSETFVDNLSSSILALAATVSVNSTAPYVNGDHVVVTVEPGTTNQATFTGEVSGNTFINCVWTEGNLAVGHNSGKSVVDYDSATHFAMAMKGIRQEHTAGGGHGDITPTSITVAGQTWNAFTGGFLEATHTWTYASATTFTVTGDFSGRYVKGTKIRLVQSSTTKFFYVLSSTYSSPNTTVTIVPNTDYLLTNNTISSPYYSYSDNPPGFPLFLNYTATLTNLSGGALTTCSYRMNGTIVTVLFRYTLAGAGVAGSVTMTTPTQIGSTLTLPNTTQLVDANGATYEGTIRGASATTVTIWSLGATSALTALSATVPHTWASPDTIETSFSYVAQ